MARILADLLRDLASGIYMSFSLSPAISLWDFSLHHYARTGVSELCLRLQDNFNVNVNVAFWALWLGHRGRALDSELLLSAEQTTNDWYEGYVKTLRQLRRQMKADYGTTNESIEAVRTCIKQAELMAEKQMQSRLEMLWDGFVPIGDALLMQNNLRFYLEHHCVDEADIKALQALTIRDN